MKDNEGNYMEADVAYGKRMQTLTLATTDDLNKVLTFYVPYSNSENPVQYYILELDENGDPVESGSKFWVQTDEMGTMLFEPSYEYRSGETGSGEATSGAASSSDRETTVTVTNTCYATYHLPESGGPGTLFYLLTGLVLIAGSAAALFTKRRLRRTQ